MSLLPPVVVFRAVIQAVEYVANAVPGTHPDLQHVLLGENAPATRRHLFTRLVAGAPIFFLLLVNFISKTLFSSNAFNVPAATLILHWVYRFQKFYLRLRSNSF